MALEEKIDKLMLSKLGTTGAQLIALLLDLSALPKTPDWITHFDHYGQGILLIGDEGMEEGPEKAALLELLYRDFAAGSVSSLVCPIALAPMATKALVEAVSGTKSEILLYGPRGTGKTIVEACIALALAKFHIAAGLPTPFRVIWVHDSLLSASVKTGRSLEGELWAGCWTLHEDRRTARFSLGGRVLIAADFAAALDETTTQRLRATAHHVIAEELVPSLTDGVGISEDKYELALSSMQRQDAKTPRKVAVASTNPGSPDHWAYKRFLGGQHPHTMAIHIPKQDRLTPEEQAALNASFSSNPILQRRLAQGEWVMMTQGQAVAEGFEPTVHVATRLLQPSPHYLLGIGWDGGHSPSAVIGQRQLGQCQVYAGLNLLNQGVLQLIEQQVRPWLKTHAPWALEHYGASLVHIIDPAMSIPGQASILDSAERMIQKHLGGRIVKGPVRWPPRREAVLRALRPAHEKGMVPLTISQSDDTEVLITSLMGRWYYAVKDGQVDRTGPEKPNSPWADLGDALAYLLDWLQGSDPMDASPPIVKVEYGTSWERPQIMIYEG